MTERDLPENFDLPDKSLELTKQPNEIKEDKLGGIDDSSMEAVDVLVARSSGVDTAQEIERIEQDIDNEADNFYKETIIPFPENIPKKVEPKRNFWERLTDAKTIKRAKAWVAAGIAAFSLSPIVASASSDAEVDLTPPTAVVTPGEMESQNAGEVTPDPTMVTDEYRQQTVAEIMNFEGPEPTPIPTEKVKNIFEVWKEQTFGPYEQELRELGCENEDRIVFGAKMLYAWDNSRDMKNTDRYDKFQNYLSREEIISFCLGDENEDVFYDEDGKPVVWQVNMTDRMKKAFKAAIDWYEDNGAPDALESVCNNGFCVLFTTVTDPERGAGSVLLTEWGVISPNKNEENTKDIPDKNLRNHFIRDLFVESYGIAYYQLVKALGLNSTGYDVLGNVEVVKSLMTTYVAESMSGFDKRYVMYAEDFAGVAETFAGNFGLSTESPWTMRQLQLILDLIDPIGFESFREVGSMGEVVALSSN